MTAYASVITLKNTIERLLNSSRISLVAPSPEIIQLANKQVKSLKILLEELDRSSKSSSRKRVNALDGEIREAVSTFEDLLESHLSEQITSQCEIRGDEAMLSRQEINFFDKIVTKLKGALRNMLNYIHIASQSHSSLGGESHPLLFSIDLQGLRKDVDSFIESVEEMEKEYIHELCNPLPEEEDEALSLTTDVGGKKSKMVGLSAELSIIRDRLTKDLGYNVIALIGMAGIGKTTLAKEIFEDPLILSHFDYHVWVTVGRNYQLNEIARGILAQVDPETGKMITEGNRRITHDLYESLKGQRYFIVLDDVWDTQVLDNLERFLQDDNNGSRVLLTTRLYEVAQHASQSMSDVFIIILPWLSKEESWDLLCQKVFAEELCPSQLQKAGKKIADNCEGLPLTIVTVANLLSKAEKTPEFWNKVAEKQDSLFVDAYDKISKVLYPSYEYLPQHLKMCFLYLGVFPQNYEIHRSELIGMWIAEGFLQPNTTQTLEDCATKCLGDLYFNNLVIYHQISSTWFFKVAIHIKTFRLHSSLWHLCNKEARKNKFFHVINSRVEGLDEGIKSQRRLCIHNNILFGVKDMYKAMEDECASTARSLLCFGPYHRYPVPICFGLRLLRVLDALKIRFYEFPKELLKLVQLRYLALTYNGNLPTFISKLWNLQFLIIHRHLSIKSCGAPSYVPIEIWDMQELKHLQIMGSSLPNPTCGTSLKNLLTLLGVSDYSCTDEVFKRIPNLKKLGIQIELAPDDDSKPLSCFDHISHLNKLESLKCVVVNPEFKSEVVVPPAPLFAFPSSLQKLHLSGLCYPWKNMSIICSLPNLQVLKLRCYAFQGLKWEIQEMGFLQLKFLMIEDTDLVEWKVGRGSFPGLRRLSIQHCYELEELHWESDNYPEEIQVVDCNPLTLTCVNQIKSRRRYRASDVYVQSSWDDRCKPQVMTPNVVERELPVCRI